MNDEELSRLDATAQAALVRSGDLSPLQLVDAAIARVERLDGELNAVIHRSFERARARARSADLPDGPFRGVPFLVKDLDATSEGEPLHGGMKYLRDAGYTADHDTFLVEQFESAGLVPIGRSNTPELGLTVTTEPVIYGPTRNPWNVALSSGGSSGGAAAAVASGMVPIAHASDGGGSIRIPASACGLVGLKPSRGRVSHGPDHGEPWSGMVISNVVSRSVRDSAAALDAISRPIPGDPYHAPTKRRPFVDELGADPGALRVGLMTGSPGGLADVHAECVRAVELAGKQLDDLGHIVEHSHPPAMDDIEVSLGCLSVVVQAWTAATLDEMERELGKPVTEDSVEIGTWLLAEAGRELSAPQFVSSMERMHAWTRRMASWWDGGFDILVTPTMATVPPPIGYLTDPSSPGPPFGERLFGVMTFTPQFNMTGQPAVSVPLHQSADGLPIGVQLVAPYGREDLLIRLAASLEQAIPWADRFAPVHA